MQNMGAAPTPLSEDPCGTNGTYTEEASGLCAAPAELQSDRGLPPQGAIPVSPSAALPRARFPCARRFASQIRPRQVQVAHPISAQLPEILLQGVPPTQGQLLESGNAAVEPSMALVGRHVSRHFPVPGFETFKGLFSGRVVGYNPTTKLFKVKYIDDDAEDLTIADLHKYLIPEEEEPEMAGDEAGAAGIGPSAVLCGTGRSW